MSRFERKLPSFDLKLCRSAKRFTPREIYDGVRRKAPDRPFVPITQNHLVAMREVGLTHEAMGRRPLPDYHSGPHLLLLTPLRGRE